MGCDHKVPPQLLYDCGETPSAHLSLVGGAKLIVYGWWCLFVCLAPGLFTFIDLLLQFRFIYFVSRKNIANICLRNKSQMHSLSCSVFILHTLSLHKFAVLISFSEMVHESLKVMFHKKVFNETKFYFENLIKRHWKCYLCMTMQFNI